MRLSEFELIKNHTYRDYCKYLQDKYGIPDGNYFTEDWKYNDRIKRSADGLFIHHILEDEIANLSNPIVAEESGEKYQIPEVLCYADYLEHFYLHLLIAKNTSFFSGLGLGGCRSYMKPDLESFYKDSEAFYSNLTYGKATYNKAYYEKIKDDEDVFTILNSLYDEIFKGRNKTLEHNAILYREVENLLDTKGKCLVELGTGLGKSTIVLQYLENHPDLRALVIAPNKTIVSDWNSRKEYGYHIEARTYQGLSKEYEINPETRYDSDFDIVILDEVHHMGYDSDEEKGALSWGSAIVNIMSQNVKTIGLSATPERSDGIDVAKYFDGCICEGMAIDEAIEKNIVHPFSYVTAVYDTDGIIDEFKEENDDPTYKKLIGELNTAVENAPAIETIINKYIGDLDPKTRKGILFVQNTSQIPSVIETVQRCFPTLEIRELHSGLTADVIANNREWFKNTENGFIVAINMISEGAHYNGVNTIMMFRQTSSYLLYLQQIGRAVTLSSKEDPKTIVFDFVNNIHTIGDYYDAAAYEISLPYKILRAIREKAEKHISTQLIVSDESEDIIRCLKKIKEYGDNSWEDWEIEILKTEYCETGAVGCQKHINDCWNSTHPECKIEHGNNRRSIYAIQKKAEAMNILSSRPVMIWSDSDDTIFFEKYQSLPFDQFMKLFPNRSRQAIKSHAFKLGISRKRQRDIICVETKQVFKSFKELEELLGYSVKTISYAIKSHGLVDNKYHFAYVDEFNEAWHPRTVQKKKSKNAIRCVETGEISYYLKELADKYRVSSPAIINCCVSKRQQTAGGYHWEYVE